MPKTSFYYTLLIRDGDKFDGQWTIEFGSYDRSDCKAEMDDLHDGHKDVPMKAMKIIATGPEQNSINAKVAELNAALN